MKFINYFIWVGCVAFLNAPSRADNNDSDTSSPVRAYAIAAQAPAQMRLGMAKADLIAAVVDNGGHCETATRPAPKSHLEYVVCDLTRPLSIDTGNKASLTQQTVPEIEQSRTSLPPGSWTWTIRDGKWVDYKVTGSTSSYQ